MSGPAPHSSRWLINQVQDFRTNQCTYSPISIALLFQYLSIRIYKLNWEVNFVLLFYIFEDNWAIGGVGLSGRYSDEVWKLHFSSILLSCQEKNSSLGNRYTVLRLLHFGRSEVCSVVITYLCNLGKASLIWGQHHLKESHRRHRCVKLFLPVLGIIISTRSGNSLNKVIYSYIIFSSRESDTLLC